MAQAIDSPVTTDRVDPAGILCRYYLHGVCTKGNNCRYSHDVNCPTSKVCTYYLKGLCAYGAQCRYDHVKPTNSPNKNRQPPPSARQAPKPSTYSGPRPSQMVKLGKSSIEGKSWYGSPVEGAAASSGKAEWAQAAEFVPGKKWVSAKQVPNSYVEAAETGVDIEKLKSVQDIKPGELCPYAAHKSCRFGESCVYTHGEVCEICGKAVLHPSDMEQQEKHRKECIKAIESEMEESFAIQRSVDKVCGICMDKVMEKNPPSEQRFGILSDCSHVFCLACIRQWRATKQLESKTIKSCPECRVKSDFVTPSRYWVEDKSEKIKLIKGYKSALSNKPCKYFDQGRGECPFNNNCFYKHAYPDGKIASPKPIRRRQRVDAEGALGTISEMLLADFLEVQDTIDLWHTIYEDDIGSLVSDLITLRDVLGISSDDDDSDVDYDVYGVW